LHPELAAVDPDLLLLPEAVGDVRRRDRAEERAGWAGVDVEPQLEGLEAGRDRAGLVDALRLVPRPLRFALLELAPQAGRRRLGEAAWQQEVAGVAAGDVHDLAAQAQLVDVLVQHDFHG